MYEFIEHIDKSKVHKRKDQNVRVFFKTISKMQVQKSWIYTVDMILEL